MLAFRVMCDHFLIEVCEILFIGICEKLFQLEEKLIQNSPFPLKICHLNVGAVFSCTLDLHYQNLAANRLTSTFTGTHAQFSDDTERVPSSQHALSWCNNERITSKFNSHKIICNKENEHTYDRSVFKGMMQMRVGCVVLSNWCFAPTLISPSLSHHLQPPLSKPLFILHLLHLNPVLVCY